MTPRRSFLLGAGSAAASLVLGDSARGTAANDAVALGVIGTGGRARYLMRSLPKLENVRAVALCDVWDEALNEAGKLAPGAKRAKDYRELLADPKLDAVLIATPDHQHVPVALAALKAGKHVYVEKPLTHTESEAGAILRAAKASDKIVQVGMQQRSMPHIAKGRELIRAGRIGTPVKVEMTWNRNADRVRRNKTGVDPKSVDWKAFLGDAPDQPFDDYRFRNWRWFWDFGGGIFTDLMVHWVDVAHWLLDTHSPARAAALGEFHTAQGVWQTPDSVQSLMQYPNGVQMHFAGTFSNARGGAHITIMGTEASLYLDRGRVVLTPEPRSKQKPTEEVVGTGPPGADFYDEPDGERLHLADWLDCVRGGKQPSAGVEAGVRAAAAAHLCNRALRGNGVARA